MRRSSAIIGSAIFLVIAPGTLAIYIPYAWTRWHVQPALLGLSWLRVLGVLFIVVGFPVLVDSFLRFAIHGLGTPAPIAPPQRLVVTGLYRYVRNPMYVAVLLMIFGQGLLFASVPLLEYGIVVWLGFFAFVLFYEEPTLRAEFGNEYRDFCANVPRWLPRVTPWKRISN